MISNYEIINKTGSGISNLRFIRNDKSKKIKVLSSLRKNLEECKTFDFSVAFVAASGLACLRQTFFNIAEKGVKGRLITSIYLGFNSPEMFEELLEFKNIECRIYNNGSFHPKGYIFNLENEESTILIGSSNLTQSALSVNQEWNVELNSADNTEVVCDVKKEFEEQWCNSIPLTKEWIEAYKAQYKKPVTLSENVEDKGTIVPNKMQEEALCSLASIHANGNERALLISATGTGKTYLSAFDVRNVNPKRLLFVVHRENIVKQAMTAFKRIIPDKTYGYYTGNFKEDADYVFATILTMSKDETLERFSRDYFDYIIIDEVHRAGAASYQKLVDYFTPKFYFGMTATPERSDGFDIYKMFDHNIAYEIRLQQAMEFDLLCPFHYYGIKDITVDGESLDDTADFKLLTDVKRMDHILKAARNYRFSGSKVHGLIFVSRKEEAQKLANYFSIVGGYKAMFLSGDDSQKTRDEAIRLLESNNPINYLDYIVTVDIFNEGIDIPCINQVIMARPTKSAIIFVQQLGRGLRKNASKEYVNIIDIIGNYNNNFMIPLALSGDSRKTGLRRFVHNPTTFINGESTIEFDEITKKRIYESIDDANLSSTKLITESYKQVKAKLGRIPSLKELDEYGDIDPIRMFENNAFGCYHSFLCKKDIDDYKVEFSDIKIKFLEYISRKLASGKRIHELEAIKRAIIDEKNIIHSLICSLKEKYQIDFNPLSKQTVVNVLTQNFLTGTGGSTYSGVTFIEQDGDDYCISKMFKKMLEDNEFYRQITEIVDFGVNRYLENYSARYKDTDLVLYKNYTYEDVCRILNWSKSINAQSIGGYKYDSRTNTFPVFINYEKRNVSETTNYEDRFIDAGHLTAISKSQRSLKSKDVQTIINAKDNNTAIHLFVRKGNDIEGAKEFYYLGLMNQSDIVKPEEFIMKGEKGVRAVRFTYDLESSVRDDILDYFESKVSANYKDLDTEK